MNLNVVLKSLKLTAAKIENDLMDNKMLAISYEEYEQLQKAIDELQALRQYLNTAMDPADQELWKDDVMAIHSSLPMNMLNELTYDIYGRAARMNGNKLSFQQYADAVRDNLGLGDYYMDDAFLQDGYDFINDLWADNDELGSNKADGSFCANPTYCGAASCKDCDGSTCRPC